MVLAPTLAPKGREILSAGPAEKARLDEAAATDSHLSSLAGRLPRTKLTHGKGGWALSGGQV